MTKTFLLFCFLSCYFLNFSQGCSDAGFCTVNANKPAMDSSNFKNQMKSGAFIGAADNNILVYGTYLEYSRTFSKKFSANVKVTSLGQSGKEASLFNLSDAFISAAYNIKKSKLNVGFKFPLNSGNRKLNGFTLPMDYQSSLGTIDFIIGYKFPVKKFTFVGAIQQPLTQNNNAFLTNQFPINSSFQNFQSTNKYQRSGDALFRISRPMEISNKIKFTPSILSIYHFTEDYFTNILNEKIKIENSEGLTMNANLYFDYSFNKKHSIQVNLGVPFVVRKIRPDGLTRSFICNFEYIYEF